MTTLTAIGVSAITRGEENRSSFARDGVEICKALLSPSAIEQVKADIDLDSQKLQMYGVRNLQKRFSSIARLVGDPTLLSVARSLLPGRGAMQLVRALFFDKTPEKNWLVTWHQDKTVTLNKRADIEGWHAWTIKDGVHHAQPPVSVLNTMITFRLHIDAADEDNGCLNVIPGSHRYGILDEKAIANAVSQASAVPCVVAAGDAVVMRPHVLHSSSKAERPDHRRVIHIEYSDYVLPDGVRWA